MYTYQLPNSRCVFFYNAGSILPQGKNLSSPVRHICLTGQGRTAPMVKNVKICYYIGMNKKKKFVITISAVILSLLLIGVSAWYFYYRDNKKVTTTPLSTTTTTIAPKTSVSNQTTVTPTEVTDTRPIMEPMNKEVNIGKTNQKNIALTFDAGSGATQTPQILDILKENNLKVTFFLTGKWAQQYPELVKRIVAEGHTLGNHTYDHTDLTTLSDSDIKTEFEKTENIIQNIVPGTSLKPYFRPPYGARNQHVWDYTASLGYQSIYWTVDALDWQEGKTVEEVKQRVFDNEKNGAIILMHVGDDLTPQALPDIINKLQQDGYKLGTLESVLK